MQNKKVEIDSSGFALRMTRNISRHIERSEISFILDFFETDSSGNGFRIARNKRAYGLPISKISSFHHQDLRTLLACSE